MPLIGIIAKKKDIKEIKKELSKSNVEIVEITKNSIKNIKNIFFDEIILLDDMNFGFEEYKHINEIILKAKYLVLNGDIENNILKEVEFKIPIRIITFGFNTKSTITVSSIKDEKMMVCLQRDIEKIDGDIIETQEKEIIIDMYNSKKTYNRLVIFIIKELHNL